MKLLREKKATGKSAPPAPGHLDANGSAKSGSTVQRRWIFRLVALFSPLLFICLIELGLRLAGYGYPTSFFLKTTRNGQMFLTENPKFAWRFFPPKLARTSQPFSLPAQKPPNTVRVFVFGESVAMGDPEPAFGFARHLERMLAARHPGKRFEVVNVAMTAINSHVMREIARDCAGQQGDCWIVYAGNTEVVGPYGAGTVFGRPAPPLAVVRLALMLKRTCLGQLASGWGKKADAPAQGEGMEMFLQQQVAHDDPRLKRVYRNFSANLVAVVRLGKQAGAKVLVATVPVNLKDCPPFASKHRSELSAAQRREWEKDFAAGREAEQQGRLAEGLAAYQAAAELDDQHAELIFRRGCCELAQSNAPAAKADFILARELDTLRFRADARINDAVRRISKASQARLVDAEESFGRADGGTLPGEGLFYDHVHPNFRGNYLLASLFLPEVERELFGSDSKGAPVLEQEAVAKQLAFTDFERKRVLEEMRSRLQQPPFSTQSNFKERYEHWQEAIASAKTAPADCLTDYRAALAQWTSDWVLHANYGRVLEAAGDASGASNEWRQVTTMIPQDPHAWFQLGNLAYNSRNYAEAEQLFQEVLDRKPDSTEALNALGLAVAGRGDLAEARRRLLQALKINPRFVSARVNLAALLAKSGDAAGAASEYRNVLGIDTNNVPARINLAQLLYQQGNISQAVVLSTEAVQLEPDEPVAQYNLANELSAQEKYAEAIPHYFAAVKARPGFVEARCNLGLELARLGRVKEALGQFAEVVRLKPDFADAHFNYGVALARQRRYSEAVREFRETLRLQPQHSAAENSLQRALLLENQQQRPVE